MQRDRSAWIDELIDAQQQGHSLDRSFYLDPLIFERDRERVLGNQWMMAGHVSQIPQQGDYLLFDVAGESIILIRGRDGAVHAHYNVCRHRGSRVLLKPSGSVRAMTCPYHAWSYALDGVLRTAPHMPEDFEPGQHALQPCALRIVEGLMFVCLSDEPAPDLSEVAAGLSPFLRLHGIAQARVAHREVFAVNANWKLAIENYLECYHCKPAHPQYCRVEIKAEKIGDGSPAALARYQARYDPWRARAEQLGTLLADYATVLPLDASLPRAQFGAAYRAPLRETHLSATQDGQPAAPLMGEFRDYDGGETALGLGPFTYMLACNDHAVFFQFVPIDAERSEIVCSWLVDGAARAGEDYDPARLTWLWTVTTRQDKSIVEGNAAGIRSQRYRPGPASLLEQDVDAFRRWYLAVIGPERGLSRLSRRGGGRYFGI